MSASTLANPGRIEIGTLKKHIFCCVIGSRAFSSENAGNTHGFFCIANGKIFFGKLVFHTVKGYERCAFGHCANNNLVAFNHVCVKAVQGLPVSHHDVVGYVHNVVYGAQTYGFEFCFQPFGTFFYLAVFYGYGTISRTSLAVFHFYVDVQIFIVYFEIIYRRAVNTRLITVANKPCIKVACHSVV